MNRSGMARCALAASLLALPVAASSGLSEGGFAIPWDSLDAGGGVAAGGPYALLDTVGQHDAGPAMAGGAFELQDGFQAGTGQRFVIESDLFVIH